MVSFIVVRPSKQTELTEQPARKLPDRATVSPGQYVRMTQEAASMEASGFNGREITISLLYWQMNFIGYDFSDPIPPIRIEVDFSLKQPTQGGKVVDWGPEGPPEYMVPKK